MRDKWTNIEPVVCNARYYEESQPNRRDDMITAVIHTSLVPIQQRAVFGWNTLIDHPGESVKRVYFLLRVIFNSAIWSSIKHGILSMRKCLML